MYFFFQKAKKEKNKSVKKGHKNQIKRFVHKFTWKPIWAYTLYRRSTSISSYSRPKWTLWSRWSRCCQHQSAWKRNEHFTQRHHLRICLKHLYRIIPTLPSKSDGSGQNPLKLNFLCWTAPKNFSGTVQQAKSALWNAEIQKNVDTILLLKTV